MDFNPVKKLLRQGSFEQALKLLDEMGDGENIIVKSYKLEVKFALKNRDDVLQQCLDIYNDVLTEGDWIKLLFIGSVYSMCLYENGDLSEAEQVCRIVIDKVDSKVLKEDEQISALANTYNTYGNTIFRLGNHKYAIELYNQSLRLREQIQDHYAIAQSLGNIGNIHNEMGIYHEAERYYLRSLDSFNQYNFEFETRITYNNLGAVYLDQGRLTESEEMLKKCIAISEKYEDEVLLSVAYNNLGNVVRSKNQFDEALVFFKNALDLRKDWGNQFQLSYSYFYLAQTYLDMHDLENFTLYMDKLRELRDTYPENKTIQIKHKLLSAVRLKSSSRVSQRAKAQILFEEITEDEENYDLEVKIQAYIYTCELLLDELNTAKESDLEDQEEFEIITEVHDIADRISELADKGNNISMQIQSIILHAYIALSQFEMQKANDLINKAKELSDKFGIRYFPIDLPDTEDHTTQMDKSSNQNYSAGSLEMKKSLNKIIHSLPKLKIIFYLVNKPYATFMEMKEDLDFSAGNLGKHCDKLADVGYVEKRKEFDGNKFVTNYRLTPLGLNEFRSYAETLKFQLQMVNI